MHYPYTRSPARPLTTTIPALVFTFTHNSTAMIVVSSSSRAVSRTQVGTLSVSEPRDTSGSHVHPPHRL
ncbi:hypothetical protein VTO73DRAFT_13074 [Trametes versicolor]